MYKDSIFNKVNIRLPIFTFRGFIHCFVALAVTFHSFYQVTRGINNHLHRNSLQVYENLAYYSPWFLYFFIHISPTADINSISVLSRRNFVTFSAGVMPTFLNTSRIVLIYIILHTLSHSVLAVWEHKEAYCLLQKFIRKEQIFFLFFILGDFFFGCPWRLNAIIFSLGAVLSTSVSFEHLATIQSLTFHS